DKPLAGKTGALVFQKPSLRTRVSFEVALLELGGHAVYLSPAEIQLGQREGVVDAARVLSRYVDIIIARVFLHSDVAGLAANTSGAIELFRDPRDAVQGADAVYTDSWYSMGQESESDIRATIFRRYQINAELMSYAAPKAIAMHCLPAHRGQEITDEVMD